MRRWLVVVTKDLGRNGLSGFFSVGFQPWTQYRDDYGGAEIGSSKAWLFNLSVVFDTINGVRIGNMM